MAREKGSRTGRCRGCNHPERVRIERLLEQAVPLLAPGAELAVELDEQEQAAPIASFARRLYPAADISICQDAGGYERVVRVVLS